MAKVSVGMLSLFNHETQEWGLYKGRLEQWFLANDITDDGDKSGAKRRAILLSSLAENTYRLVRDLAIPQNVGSLTYLEVTSLFDGHFRSKKCGFAERFKFHSAVQEIGESASQWAARVRGLAMHCGFAASALNEALRDRFVLGMAAGPERDRMFVENMEELTLDKALQLAENMRCTCEGARQAPAARELLLDVHKVEVRAEWARPAAGVATAAVHGASATVQYAVCGYLGHDSKMCKFKNYMCRKGHLKRICKKFAKNLHFLQCEADTDDGMHLICNIRSIHGEPMQESIQVEDVVLNFQIDSATYSELFV